MKAPSAFLRVRGTLVLSVFLVITVVVAVQGAFATRNNITDTFAAQSEIVQARLALDDMDKLQIEEENFVRGFTLTRDAFYREQYAQAVANFDARAARVRQALSSQRLTSASALLDGYLALQTEWRRKIAEPLLANPSLDAEILDKESKLFADNEGRATQQISDTLAAASDRLGASSQSQVNSNAWARAFWLALFGLVAILLSGFGSRLVGELEEERTTTEILQRAFRSEAVVLPHTEVGTAYLSASSHVAVGGDVFDVYRLSDKLALVFIADVSGKGVDAAVLTAFIKFTIRGIALRRRDPGAMLGEFNTAFSQTVENPYLFVSMLVGVLDIETLQFRYASAGHDSAYVRTKDEVKQLAVTGPVLGVMEEPFETKIVYLEDGDTIVLTTDGLTEARNRNGEFLQETGAMELIAHSSRKPQLLADELTAQVKARGGNQTRDDLAILAIRVHDPGRHDDEA